MDKLNKYLHRVVAQHNGQVIYSQRSTYYHICGRIIRVSDHIGRNSDGSISIIYDASGSDNFIVHGHESGMISVVNYENLKKIIKSFTILPAIIGVLSSPAPKRKHEEVNPGNKVLGYNINKFSKGQQKMINELVKQMKKNENSPKKLIDPAA